MRKISKHYKPNYTAFTRLSAYPSLLKNNPGVAQAAKIYKFFVPLHGQVSPYMKQKPVDHEENKVPSNSYQNNFSQEGKGSVLESEENKKTVNGKQDIDTFLEEKNQVDAQHLGENVYNAFQHPFVKVNKVTFIPKDNKIGLGANNEKKSKGSKKLLSKMCIV